MNANGIAGMRWLGGATMFIENFEISNYKCFEESGPISLCPGMVVLTGPNGSGKTAALEALSLRFGLNPHRSLSRTAAEFESSSIKVTCRVLPEELVEIAQSGKVLAVPGPRPGTPFLQSIDISTPANMYQIAPLDEVKFLRWFMDQGALRIRFSLEVRGNGQTFETCTFLDLASIPKATRTNAETLYYKVKIGRDWTPQVVNREWSSREISALDVQSIASRIYRFSPERFCAGTSGYGDSTTLKTDASNLPEVLNCLQSNPKKFREYNEIVSRVLPQVKWVNVRARTPNNEISVWFIGPESGRDDLAIPLVDCGTGVGHVLAILYVLYTSTTSRTILIDEPQSFLHPGAARKLMEVLSEFQKHQLIIATHSPTMISTGAVNQALCFGAGESSAISSISLDDAEHRATLLNELGARLADVYGADNILWVEGPTEEECFPKILRKLHPRSLAATAVLAVRKTGDLEGKDAERVFEIYGSLSNSSSLLPPTIGFLFDGECRSDDKLKELTKKSDGLLRTIGRRCYENYLLSSVAIASVINRFDKGRTVPLDADEVKARLEELFKDAKYSCKGLPALKGNRDFIDAARLLRDVFNEFTECRVSFEKTLHSVELTNWILDNEPERLKPLADILRECLRNSGSTGA
jgi:predicted ATPase